MSCPICGRGNCCESFHSHAEQERYAPAIEAFERYLEIRQRIYNDIEQEAEAAPECERCGCTDKPLHEGYCPECCR